jgi:3'-phosphoadenosine 5'-phosphosulfate sulfotransferase (PAPS reductase)/FAD synthetase
MSRVIAWFSCGAPSAVAAKLACQKHGDRCEVVYCDTGGEHEDNKRFLQDVARWLERDVTVLKNPNFADHFDVIRYHRYFNGPTSAKCTRELKRKLREKYQRPDDVHVWGFTVEEEDRACDFAERNTELRCEWPLIDEGLTREDCLAIVARAGIEIPAMYKMGYRNNNCIGCVKGGMGYWNKVRRDFPEHFAKMAALEREIGATVLHRDGSPLYLDELDPSAGRYKDEPEAQCGIVCHLVELKMRGEE